VSEHVHAYARASNSSYASVRARVETRMAMDRTMYGKVEPGGTYQPYRITVKKGSPPGCKFLKWGIRPKCWILFAKINWCFNCTALLIFINSRCISHCSIN